MKRSPNPSAAFARPDRGPSRISRARRPHLASLLVLLALSTSTVGCGSSMSPSTSGADAGFGGVNPVPTPGTGHSDAGATDAGWVRVEDGAVWTAFDAGADAGASDAGVEPEPDAGGNTGLSQAGAQDFGLFRQILEAGGIPAPGTLDDLGFFAEHKLDYDDPTCGQDMCMHALLGQMGNLITGTACTLTQIGLNTPIQVDKLTRPPLHMVLAIDVSGSMEGKPMAFVKQGLTQLLDNLQPEDHLTLVTFAGKATTVFEHLGVADTQTMLKAVAALSTAPQTNLYDGLFTAFSKAAKHLEKGTESRVVVLSDGVPTTGIAKTSKFVSLTKAYAVQGVGLTTVGIGQGASAKTLRAVSEVGAGNFYFLDQPAAVKEVFTEEVKTFVVPVALDVKIDIDLGDAWVVRAGYGTHGFKAKDGGATVHIPALFLAGRLKSDDPLPSTPGTGRRGGGGAIIIESRQLPGVVPKSTQVGTVSLSWKHPQSGKVITQTASVDKKFAKVQMADGGVFTNKTVEKGFVMLNLLVGFQQASQLAVDGDPGAAIGGLTALRNAVQGWLSDQVANGGKADPDIADDLVYVDLFLANLAKLKQQTPVSKPPEPWPWAPTD